MAEWLSMLWVHVYFGSCVTSQVLLAGGQVVFLGDLPFSLHLTTESAQKE